MFDTIAGSGVMEWKTPPLWGCAASAPYLHDGRAGTLHESIMLHGGEATVSRNRYAALDTLSRQRVVSFLQSLAPPGHHELPTE